MAHAAVAVDKLTARFAVAAGIVFMAGAIAAAVSVAVGAGEDSAANFAAAAGIVLLVGTTVPSSSYHGNLPPPCGVRSEVT